MSDAGYLLQLRRATFGEVPSEIGSYEAAYQRAVSRLEAGSHRLLRQVPLCQAEVTLVGDFHSDTSGVDEWVATLNERKRVYPKLFVMLESLRLPSQGAVNRFLAGRMPLEDLYEACRFAETWGFAWWITARLLAVCRDLGVPVYALSPSCRAQLTLAERSTFFAAQIRRRMEQTGPGSHGWVLVGELHLDPDKLPRSLRAYRSLVIAPSVAGRRPQHGDLRVALDRCGQVYHLRRGGASWRWMGAVLWQKLREAGRDRTLDRRGSDVAPVHLDPASAGLWRRTLEHLLLASAAESLAVRRLKKIKYWQHSFVPPTKLRQGSRLVRLPFGSGASLWLVQGPAQAWCCDVFDWRTLPLVLALLSCRRARPSQDELRRAYGSWLARLRLGGAPERVDQRVAGPICVVSS